MLETTGLDTATDVFGVAFKKGNELVPHCKSDEVLEALKFVSNVKLRVVKVIYEEFIKSPVQAIQTLFVGKLKWKYKWLFSKAGDNLTSAHKYPVPQSIIEAHCIFLVAKLNSIKTTF